LISEGLSPVFAILAFMVKFIFLVIISSTILFSCSKYRAFKSDYTFKSKNSEPNYSDLDYWAAHPWKHDPSDSIPKPLRHETRDSSVDVFFLHPTSYTKKLKLKKLNADIDNSYINAKTDYSSILYQASVFNQQCRVFAPRYRQAHIKNFFTKDKEKANSAFDIAYKDLKTAFIFYMQHWNNGRPIIIASHSQGSKMAEQLLKEFFDGKGFSKESLSTFGEENQSIKNKLVVAYLVGWPVPKGYFTSLKMCTDSLQTGCLCSWRTFRKGYIPSYLKNENGISFATNPLTWTTGDEYASKQLNKGSVLTKFNKVYKQTNDAQIHNGLLWIKKPKFPWSFLYFRRNYHPGDINLFYLNIRENIRQRINMYWKQ
jgi:Protein of unknown function (DUF3089)